MNSFKIIRDGCHLYLIENNNKTEKMDLKQNKRNPVMLNIIIKTLDYNLLCAHCINLILIVNFLLVV